MFVGRRKIGFAAALGALAVTSHVHAGYQEAHQTGDDVKITIDRAGQARVEHTVRYHVVAGTLTKIDLRGVDPGFAVDSTATITSDDGKELGAHASSDGERNVHVTVDEPKGLKRGLYTFRVRYSVDLVAAHALERDGAMWRFSWTSAVAPEGYDGARVVLAFPPAQTEPRAVKTGPGDGAQTAGEGERVEGGEDGVLSTLRRTTDADELELVRPHISRGESAKWVARLDPKAFPDVRTPELRPLPVLAPPPPNRAREVGYGVALLAIALAFGGALRAKGRAFVAAAAPARAPTLVPLGVDARAAIGGLAFAGGVGVQALGWTTAGAALVAIAMLMGVSRVVRAAVRPRGPGRWLALRPAEAFDATATTRGAASTQNGERRSPGDVFDIGTTAGKLAAFGIALALAAIAVAAHTLSPAAPYLVALDALALVPIFVTGGRAQLPPNPVRAPVALLRTLARRLAGDKNLRIAPWARIPLGGDAPDELRLLVVPRGAMPGLVGVEIGVNWGRSATGYIGSPEVLVRVHDGSAAAAKIAKLLPFFRSIPGRKEEERVIRLLPRLPGVRATKALVDRLAHELADRRIAEAAPWKGKDRRLPKNPKVKLPIAA